MSLGKPTKPILYLCLCVNSAKKYLEEIKATISSVFSPEGSKKMSQEVLEVHENIEELQRLLNRISRVQRYLLDDMDQDNQEQGLMNQGDQDYTALDNLITEFLRQSSPTDESMEYLVFHLMIDHQIPYSYIIALLRKKLYGNADAEVLKLDEDYENSIARAIAKATAAYYREVGNDPLPAAA